MCLWEGGGSGVSVSCSLMHNRLTFLGTIVDELVEAVEVWLGSTVNVVPPENALFRLDYRPMHHMDRHM